MPHIIRMIILGEYRVKYLRRTNLHTYNTNNKPRSLKKATYGEVLRIFYTVSSRPVLDFQFGSGGDNKKDASIQ